MWATFVRVVKSGWSSFWRNKWLSSAAVFMMSLAILGISSLLMINVLINSFTNALEEKVDISVYFNLDANQEAILAARAELVKLNEVKSVEYVSQEEALSRFKEKHQDNEVLMQSLNELGNNPLEASLNIKAQETTQYQVIVDFFNQEEYQSIVDKINYLENKTVIERLASITSAIRQVAFIGLMILVILAILVTFNTIRLTIYSARKEIKVMKLVGASNWFARGPFIIEGAMYGVAAAIISFFVLYPLLWYFSPKITLYLPGTDLLYFFQSNLIAIFLIQLGVGVILGTVSSLVAIKRYLDV